MRNDRTLRKDYRLDKKYLKIWYLKIIGKVAKKPSNGKMY